MTALAQGPQGRAVAGFLVAVIVWLGPQSRAWVLPPRPEALSPPSARQRTATTPGRITLQPQPGTCRSPRRCRPLTTRILVTAEVTRLKHLSFRSQGQEKARASSRRLLLLKQALKAAPSWPSGTTRPPTAHRPVPAARRGIRTTGRSSKRTERGLEGLPHSCGRSRGDPGRCRQKS